MKQFKTHGRRFLVLLVGAYLVTSWVYASAAMSGQSRKHDIPALAGIEPEPVTLENGEISLDGGFYPNPADEACAVVMVHGIDADRVSVLGYAPLYWDHGCSVFAFDHRDHGRSSETHRTYGLHEAADTELAIEWVVDRTGLPPGRIGLHGVSFGAATALEVLDRRDDLAFIIADSPYSSMRSIIAHSAGDTLGIAEPIVRPLAFFLIERRAGIEIGKVDPATAVADKVTPILLIHTADDTVVPVENSALIAKNNPTIERHVLEADGIHLHAYPVRTAAYTSIVDDFFLRRAPTWPTRPTS